jgi:hypothetical protein
MHRSGKEEAVCSPLSRVLQADVREGLELELASRDSLPEDGSAQAGWSRAGVGGTRAKGKRPGV